MMLYHDSMTVSVLLEQPCNAPVNINPRTPRPGT